ncbi:hypothetical protein BC833DRAFT_612674 [Globomyces pollinis-pini]|nr:hypothetical protein BC833DRAFT_612674 [Globomyces pollinis-pini]
MKISTENEAERKREMECAYRSPPLSEHDFDHWTSSIDSLNDQWRFVIHPQDIGLSTDIFKPAVKERLGVVNIQSDISCPTYLLFSNAYANDSNVAQDDESDEGSLATMPSHKKLIPSSSRVDRSDTKTFRCQICSSSFSRNHDLKRHVRIHLGIRPYACETCPKMFSRMDALHRHTNVRGCKGYRR